MSTPLIGVLAQETVGIRKKDVDFPYDSYIPKACVDFAKATGAKVVPILIDKDEEYYKEILNRLNCIIFPGGATYFNAPNEPNSFRKAGKIILDITTNINDRGIKLPIFGICLGMQLLIYLTTDQDREDCEMNSNMEPFRMDPECRMFSRSTPEERTLFEFDVVEYHNQRCYTIENTPLDYWEVISSRQLNDGRTMITAVEAKRYPFYGVQFHPEKPEFEPKSICSAELKNVAITANRFFIRFLEQSLSNSNVSSNIDDLNLIDNYDDIDASDYSSNVSRYYVFN